MRFTQHYSGSSGNLYTVEANNGKRLIIDPGVRWNKILDAMDYDISSVVGCLLTHEHKDHGMSILHVMKAGIDAYASCGTWRILPAKNHRRAVVLGHFEKWYTPVNGNGDFQFMPFHTLHDAEDSLGYVVKCDREYLLFATDTAFIRQRFNVAFDIIAIECSYDRAILQERVDTGTINESLAKRLLSSHMEKQETIRYLKEFCDLSKCREIHLLHMSRDNIEAEETRKEIENMFFIKTIIKV